MHFWAQTQNHSRRTARDANLPPKMRESWKASSVAVASVTFLPFSSWWNWGFSCCGSKISLEATGTIFRSSLEAGLWSSPALEAGVWSSPEDVCAAVELPACCSPSCSLEMGTLIGICVTLVRRKSSNGSCFTYTTGPRIQQTNYRPCVGSSKDCSVFKGETRQRRNRTLNILYEILLWPSFQNASLHHTSRCLLNIFM